MLQEKARCVHRVKSLPRNDAPAIVSRRHVPTPRRRLLRHACACTRGTSRAAQRPVPFADRATTPAAPRKRAYYRRLTLTRCANVPAGRRRCPAFSSVWLIAINFVYFLVGMILIGLSAWGITTSQNNPITQGECGTQRISDAGLPREGGRAQAPRREWAGNPA